MNTLTVGIDKGGFFRNFLNPEPADDGEVMEMLAMVMEGEAARQLP